MFVRYWAELCEFGECNFFDVPFVFQLRVRVRIEKDGYIINDDGTVVRNF